MAHGSVLRLSGERRALLAPSAGHVVVGATRSGSHRPARRLECALWALLVAGALGIFVALRFTAARVHPARSAALTQEAASKTQRQAAQSVLTASAAAGLTHPAPDGQRHNTDRTIVPDGSEASESTHSQTRSSAPLAPQALPMAMRTAMPGPLSQSEAGATTSAQPHNPAADSPAPYTAEECHALLEQLSGRASSANERLQRAPQPGQCWSVREWGCFARGPFPQTPGAALQAELEQYRARWRKCHAQESSAQVLHALLQGRPTACQYLLWVPTMFGVGNQVMSLVAAFVYAMLTQRILLLAKDNARALDAVFCEPFPDDTPPLPSWVLDGAGAISAKYCREVPLGARVYSKEPQAQADETWNPPFHFSKEPPPVACAYVYQRLHVDYLFCESFFQWVRPARMLVLESNMYLVPALYVLPHFRAHLGRLIPSRRVFATLAPAILHPSNEVWRMVTSALLKVTAAQQKGQPSARGGTGLHVGVQFREAFLVPADEALKFMLVCLERIVEGVGGAQAAKAKPLLAYLFTLDPAFRGNFSRAVMARHSGSGAVFAMSRDTEQNSSDLSHNQRALADMLTMALASDHLVLTPRSTFGYVAQGFSAAQSAHFFSDSCLPAHPEPCYLLPPRNVTCPFQGPTLVLEAAMLQESSQGHLQLCPDEAWVFNNQSRRPTTFIGAEWDFVQQEGLAVKMP